MEVFGSYTVDSLVRAGIGNIVLIDNALIDVTNLNSNLMADTKVVGKYKVEIAKKRLLDVNPNLNIKVVKEYINKENAPRLVLNNFDYIVDTIDSLADKLALIVESKRKNIPIISSMGTGDKFDPTQFEVSDISKVKDCSFANLLKAELKKNEIEHLKIIYSKEKTTRFRSTEETYKSKMSSISFVPSIVGIIISSEVVKDLIEIHNRK